MRRRVLVGLAVGVLSVGCASNDASRLAGQTVTTRVQLVVRAPRLTSVPDIPTVAGARVDVDAIHAALDHYGDWVDDGRYGVVWMPSQAAGVGPDFVPYGTNGQWVLTDAGWYWQSGYEWGWLTFHYGRWVTIEQSWAWVPGSLFAPAWVDWRVGVGWVGWAALPPRGVPFSAPYAYCQQGHLAGPGVWANVVYGPAGASLYSTTHSLPTAYGFRGVTYAWGPTPTASTGALAVPVATAWRGETGARMGLPAGSSGGAGVGARAGVPVGNGSVDGDLTARPAGATPGQPAPAQMVPSAEVARRADRAPAAAFAPGAVAAMRDGTVAVDPTRVVASGAATAQAGPEVDRVGSARGPYVPAAAATGVARWPSEAAAVSPYATVSSRSYGRLRDTITISGALPAGGAPRETVSLGTVDGYNAPRPASSGYGPAAYAPSAAAAPAYAPAYAPSAYGGPATVHAASMAQPMIPMPSAAYVPAAPSAYPSAVHYSAPTPSAAPAAWNPTPYAAAAAPAPAAYTPPTYAPPAYAAPATYAPAAVAPPAPSFQYAAPAAVPTGAMPQATPAAYNFRPFRR